MGDLMVLDWLSLLYKGVEAAYIVRYLVRLVGLWTRAVWVD